MAVPILKPALRRVSAFAALYAVIACGMFAACDRGEEQPAPPPTREPGMVLLKAAGKTFHQGATGAAALPEEGPSFDSRFSYDFLLDSTEVTQAAFERLVGRNPVLAGSRYGSGPDFPVYLVSWFDAALFANARSKAAGLDTVYAYSQALRSPTGSVYELSNLDIRLDRYGYRLPTEAEWEFAARGGSPDEFPWGGTADSGMARRYAWYAANSGGTAHPVGKLDANAYGLKDMAGNVMEWVNDWKGGYPAAAAADFAGARDPGPQAEAPVKGGAFRYGLIPLRPSARSATYATLRSATAEYVGFRCALGSIAKPKFSVGKGALAETDPVRLQRTRLDVLTGGRPAKLVFVNATPETRHLALIDFTRRPARVQEFADDGRVFHPTLSPDGEWVAYGTAAEGTISGSTLYVRSLADGDTAPCEVGPGFIPRWWVDPAARDTFLIFATTGADNTQGPWASGRTRMQRMSGGRPQGAPTDLSEAGAFHDGRSRNGRWLATGFRLLKVRDDRTREVRTLFTAPGNGKSAGDTSQVCNVSIAPDSSGRMLFLDFGYEGISTLTRSWYDVHAMAFMADPEGKVLGWFPAPAGERGWDDLEWSNHPDFAVAAATDPKGGHGRLYLLNLADSSSNLIASGTHLATPGLWLGDAIDPLLVGSLNPDSLGHYNEPATDHYQGIFSAKMALYWKRHAAAEVIFTGSSHVLTGIAPGKIKGKQTLDVAYSACGWLGQEAWARAYAMRHSPNLKVLVMEAFPGWLHQPDGDLTWKPQISLTRGVRYDEAHGFWQDGLPPGFRELMARAPNLDLPYMDSLGSIHSESVGWGEVVKPVESEWEYGDPNAQATLARMEAFAREVAARKIHLLFVNHPTHPGFKGTAYYGPYGPRTSVADQVIARFRSMESISPYVHFYDAHNSGAHDYTDADAINSGHLSAAGAARLTTRLDSLIATFAP